MLQTPCVILCVLCPKPTSDQALYGIVQGGAYEDLRKASATYIGKLPFDGFGIGGSFGSSFGSAKENTANELLWTVPYLPERKPRHLLGMGRVEDLFIGVEAGIDTFDCVIPTREARHGGIWPSSGGGYENVRHVREQRWRAVRRQILHLGSDAGGS
jgi:tRNA-guanine family transglycosylase